MEHISLTERVKPLRDQKICRTCMSKDSNWADETNRDILLLSINEFPPENETIDISRLLLRAIPEVTYVSDDELPQKICARCLEKLNEVDRFQQMCITSEFELRCVVDSVALVEKVFGKKQEDFLEYDTDGEESDFVKLEIDDTLEVGARKFMQNICKSYKEIPTKNKFIHEKAISAPDNQFNFKIKNKTKEEIHKPKSDNSEKVTFKSKENITKRQKIEKSNSPVQNKDQLGNDNSNGSHNHKCLKCMQIFPQLDLLEQHKLVHDETQTKPTKQKKMESNLDELLCTKCGIKFDTFKLFHDHEPCKNSNKYDNKTHVCNYCQKAFQQSCTLKNHIRTHTGEQPYLCSECGKAFKSISNMKQHVLRHSGEKRYECPDCPKKFPCSSDLASHKAVHKKIKPHICDICGSAFGKPYQLKKHKMYHNGDKPHKCEYCEMRFVCADHMRRHMRTHTGEKPYKCKYCVRAFTQSNDLVKHLRAHLGDNVYQCELCPKAFRLAAELRVHFAEHKMKSESTRENQNKALTE